MWEQLGTLFFPAICFPSLPVERNGGLVPSRKINWSRTFRHCSISWVGCCCIQWLGKYRMAFWIMHISDLIEPSTSHFSNLFPSIQNHASQTLRMQYSGVNIWGWISTPIGTAISSIFHVGIGQAWRARDHVIDMTLFQLEKFISCPIFFLHIQEAILLGEDLSKKWMEGTRKETKRDTYEEKRVQESRKKIKFMGKGNSFYD